MQLLEMVIIREAITILANKRKRGGLWIEQGSTRPNVLILSDDITLAIRVPCGKRAILSAVVPARDSLEHNLIIMIRPLCMASIKFMRTI